MNIIPYERLTLATSLTVAEAQRRLADAVGPPRLFRFGWSRPERPFTGSVEGYTFLIRRAITYRNSFRPRVQGRIVQGPSGAAIELTLSLEPVVAVFMGIWLAFATVIFIEFGIMVLTDPGLQGPPVFIPFVFLPFGLLLTTFGFGYEAAKTKQALRELFLAYPTG